MAPIRNGGVIFADIPTGYPEPGKHLKYVEDRTIELDTVDLAGGVLVKNLVISIDPYMRGRMRSPEKKSYAPPYVVGELIYNFFVGKIIRSEHEKFEVNKYVGGMGFYEEYSVFPKAKAESLHILTDDQLKLGLSLTTWVGAAGMPGQTAYYSLYNIGEPKKGETIFITGASGAVGQIVGQLAKREGLKVIGSAGTDDKVQWLKDELNFDHVFNYKTADARTELSKFDPLNIYFDNVGGDQLEAALDAAGPFARFIECGMISQYNEQDGHGIRNLMNVVWKRIKLQGFIVSDAFTDGKFLPEFYSKVPKWIADGEIKIKEDVTKGLENAPEAIVGIFRGLNFGKAVIQIADD